MFLLNRPSLLTQMSRGVESQARKCKGSRAGFYSISGAAVDAQGKLYFVDHYEQRIYGWSASEGLTIERDNPLDPVNLAFDKTGDLLVLSSAGPEGTVYCFRPGSTEDKVRGTFAGRNQAAAGCAGAHACESTRIMANLKINSISRHLRIRRWRKCSARDVSAPKAKQYVSPDGSVFLPAGRVFQQGPPDYTGWRFSDNLDTYGFIGALRGQRV